VHKRKLSRTALILLLTWAAATPALADNPLNSSETPDPTKPLPARPKDDFTAVPVAGGSTDVGIGGGFFSALTRNQAGRDPYIWNLEAAWFISFASRDGAIEVPYDDGYLKLTVPRFLDAPLRLEVRPSFTDEETLYYYGMGNASSAAPPAGALNRYFQYGRVHPSISAEVTFRILDHVASKIGIRYLASRIHVTSDSKLGTDLREGSGEVKTLIGSTAGMQSVALLRYGLQLDTRDNETSPHRGTWDEAYLKVSPGSSESPFPNRYAQATAIFRVYASLIANRMTLAARVVGDALFGDPPFSELPRYEDTYALGGSNGVRGVPAQRYYGKIKIFGNLEIRERLFDFRVFMKRMTLGAACFFDGGRLWADWSRHPELDGTGLGLKYGTGAGLRLSSGTAFVLRGDVAWSPDATPVGAYVAAGETF
jgi:outer membrane protein assembly factor BamA